MDRYTSLQRKSVYVRPQKLETSAISGEVGVEGRLTFLYIPFYNAEIFSHMYICIIFNPNWAGFSLGLPLGLRGCNSTSVGPVHCFWNCWGINSWPHTTPEWPFPKASQPNSLTALKILQRLSTAPTLTQHIQPFKLTLISCPTLLPSTQSNYI